MRFKKIELYKNTKTGEDELGNPITQPDLLAEATGAITQWTTEEIALLEREVTRTQRKLITSASREVLKQVSSIKVEGSFYRVVDVKSDFVRWRLVHVKELFS